MYVGDIAYAIPQGAHRMKVPLRGSDVRRKFIGDEFQGRVVREVEGAALENECPFWKLTSEKP